jgi:hypothetical protein
MTSGWDERFVLPKSICINAVGMREFIQYSTQSLVGARANCKTGDRLVFSVQGIGNPNVIFLASNKRLDLIDFINAVRYNVWRDHIFCYCKNARHQGRSRYFQKTSKTANTDSLFDMTDDVVVYLRVVGEIAIFFLLLSVTIFTLNPLFAILLRSIFNTIASAKPAFHFSVP